MAKKSTQDKGYELAAVIRVFNGLDYGNAKISFFKRMPDGDVWNFHYGEFDSLQLVCQWDKADSDYRKRGKPYGFNVEYRDSTTMENFTQRVPLLMKIKNGLERAYKKNGECETFGEYVVRIFNILGVEVLLEPRDGVTLERGAVWQPSEIKNVFNRLLAGTLEAK